MTQNKREVKHLDPNNNIKVLLSVFHTFLSITEERILNLIKSVFHLLSSLQFYKLPVSFCYKISTRNGILTTSGSITFTFDLDKKGYITKTYLFSLICREHSVKVFKIHDSVNLEKMKGFTTDPNGLQFTFIIHCMYHTVRILDKILKAILAL